MFVLVWHCRPPPTTGALGDEQRALFNLGATRGDSARTHLGLNGWGPNINTVRDPRYGRNSELPSEDPTHQPGNVSHPQGRKSLATPLSPCKYCAGVYDLGR